MRRLVTVEPLGCIEFPDPPQIADQDDLVDSARHVLASFAVVVYTRGGPHSDLNHLNLRQTHRGGAQDCGAARTPTLAVFAAADHPRKVHSVTCKPSATGRPHPQSEEYRPAICRATGSIVITGLSGSGKSSLAFDTLYAEGQRRYVESLSAYARQFLSMMEKPDVDTSRASRRRSRSSRSRRRTIRARRSARSPKSTTTCGCCRPRRRAALPRSRHRTRRADRQPDGRSGARAAGGARIMVLAPVVRTAKANTPSDRGPAGRGFVRGRIDGAVVGTRPATETRCAPQEHGRVVVDRFKGEPTSGNVRRKIGLKPRCAWASGVARVAYTGTELTFALSSVFSDKSPRARSATIR